MPLTLPAPGPPEGSGSGSRARWAGYVSRAIASLCAAFGIGGCATHVVRVVDGRPVDGREIPAVAYAYYARSLDAVARGELPEALGALRHAAAADPEGPDAPTRLGALLCQMGDPAARDAFDEAEARDPTYAPLYEARALCAFGQADWPHAIVLAERAVALDPENVDASILRARALVRGGRLEEAKRILWGLSVRRPYLTAPWLELMAVAELTSDRSLAEDAARRAIDLQPDLRTSLATRAPSVAPLAAIDSAISKGDAAKAERLATKLRLPLGELSLRAAALGRTAMATDLATAVMQADPSDSAARIAVAASADLEGDAPRAADALRGIPAKVVPLSILGRVLLAELVLRRAGATAAATWMSANDVRAALKAAVDPLVISAAKRVEAKARP